jgi:hypothetical protein
MRDKIYRTDLKIYDIKKGVDMNKSYVNTEHAVVLADFNPVVMFPPHSPGPSHKVSQLLGFRCAGNPGGNLIEREFNRPTIRY